MSRHENEVPDVIAVHKARRHSRDNPHQLRGRRRQNRLRTPASAIRPLSMITRRSPDEEQRQFVGDYEHSRFGRDHEFLHKSTLLDQNGIQRGRRLIPQHEVRLRDNRPRYLLLTLSAAQAAGAMMQRRGYIYFSTLPGCLQAFA